MNTVPEIFSGRFSSVKDVDEQINTLPGAFTGRIHSSNHHMQSLTPWTLPSARLRYVN
jgi:hypothetical protein